MSHKRTSEPDGRGLYGVAGRGIWRAWSAGLEPKDDIDPALLEFLMRAGLGRRHLYSKSWRAFAVYGVPLIDLAVSVVEGTESLSQVDLPGHPRWMTWRFDGALDPEYPSALRQQTLLQSLAEVRRHIDSLLFVGPGIQRRVA